MVVEFSSRVFGGMPVTVEAVIYPAEPDVGYMHDHAEIERLLFPNGREFTPKLYQKVQPDEWCRLQEEAVLEACC